MNCAAIPENLAEAELFGHAKGAFTSAVNHRVGHFEQAHRGTIFLDEIGEIPMEVQPKLLRVLQERELQRVGSSETIQLDTRVIAAANIDLELAVEQKKFREDLLYRLNVVPIQRSAAAGARQRYSAAGGTLQPEDLPPRRLSNQDRVSQRHGTPDGLPVARECPPA